MEVVNIFLAGSTQLEAMRTLIRTCANKLQADNCAKGRNIAINITTFENFNSAISKVKAQELYDAYIHSEADYAMFVFDDEVGRISKHEFNVAYDACKHNNRPTLYVYFKKSATYCPEYTEIRHLLENTSHYFKEYNDTYEFSAMIDSHLREMIEPNIEKIILNSHKAKGQLELITNRACIVTENSSIVTNTEANTPSKVELSEGLHILEFKERTGSKTIERKIRVIKDTKRNIEVLFPTNIQQKRNDNSIYYIVVAMLIAAIAVICIHKISRIISDEPDPFYYPDERKDPGGEKYQLALTYLEKGNIPMAVELLQAVINSEPDFADPYIHLAHIYIQQENIVKAQELLTKALELNPNSEWASKLYNSISK